jgi:DNA-binding response OmpR family regulator
MRPIAAAALLYAVYDRCQTVDVSTTGAFMADPTVLLVEDEENIAQAVRYSLEKQGLRPLLAQDGEQALEMARQHRPDVIVLDVMLPKLDGFEVCRILRRESDVPILMLTARGEEMDRVVGLEIGADDYVTKPFSMRELVARVRALLRRGRRAAVAVPSSASSQVLRAAGLEVDLTAHAVRRAGAALDLRPREFDLLALLIANPGRAYTREQILDRVWGEDYIGDTRTVDVHIRWLREKIEPDPARPKHIITIRGLGYRFEA